MPLKKCNKVDTYHILNGDALKEHFPSALSGELIVARECLVDGNVQGDSLDELFANRAKHIESYSEVPEGEYFKITVPEINKIRNIPQGTKVYCWFEEDLFCQVNFWFVLHLLVEKLSVNELYLVRPSKGNEYAFGHMNSEGLQKAYEQASQISIVEFEALSKLWRLYQHENYNDMLKIAEGFTDKYSFLAPAIQAQIDRLPDFTGLGRPERSLLAIMNELKTKEFPAVFSVFHQREAIYSFGDLQVKRMFDELLKRK